MTPSLTGSNEAAPPLTVAEVKRLFGRLREVLASGQVVLIGGQAISPWRDQLADYLPDSAHRVTSGDLDFQDRRIHLLATAKALDGIARSPDFENMSPMVGFVRFVDEASYERQVDFLPSPHGLDDEMVIKRARTLTVPLEDGRCPCACSRPTAPGSRSRPRSFPPTAATCSINSRGCGHVLRCAALAPTRASAPAPIRPPQRRSRASTTGHTSPKRISAPNSSSPAMYRQNTPKGMGAQGTKPRPHHHRAIGGMASFASPGRLKRRRPTTRTQLDRQRAVAARIVSNVLLTSVLSRPAEILATHSFMRCASNT